MGARTKSGGGLVATAAEGSRTPTAQASAAGSRGTVRPVHPIERLRMVARAAGEGPALLAQEAAGALAAFADDPPGLVTACRRLVGRQPTSGPMWWLATRVLTAGEPGGEAWRAGNELEMDPTPRVLAGFLPD